jgi:tetratricopeptide (TPR) repeat protein
VDDPEGVAALAEEHWRRYLADRTAGDLDMAIRLYDSLLGVRADLVPEQVRNALIAAAEPDSDDLDDQAGYAAEIVAVVQAVDDPALLDQAITLLRAVVIDTPVDHPRLGAHLSDLGLVLQLRHRRTNRLDDLDEALRTARRAVELTSSADPAWPTMASNLAAGLLRRFKVAGAVADLDEAVAVLRPAQRAPAEGGEWGLALQTLSDALRLIAARSRSGPTLDDAIEIGRRAIARTPRDDPGHSRRIANLANGLLDRFDNTGDGRDLDDGIALYREAVADQALDAGDAALIQANLSKALQTRFARNGEVADIEESVRVGRSAQRFARVDESAGMASNLSGALLRRFERLGDQRDLDEAVRLSRSARDQTPASHLMRPARSANLGNALLRRFEANRRAADIDEAVATLSEAEAASSGDAVILFNLAAALRTRFAHGDEVADLDLSIRHSRTALHRCSATSPDRASLLLNLGLALQSRHRRTRGEADRDEAVAAWQAAARIRNARASTRLGAARAWASAAASEAQWESAADGYATAAELLPILASRAARRPSREALLTRARTVAADGAACAILTNRPGRAMVLTEQGRNVLWSQLLETRGDVAALRDTVPQLAERLTSIGGALEAIDDGEVDAQGTDSAGSSSQ